MSKLCMLCEKEAESSENDLCTDCINENEIESEIREMEEWNDYQQLIWG